MMHITELPVFSSVTPPSRAKVLNLRALMELRLSRCGTRRCRLG